MKARPLALTDSCTLPLPGRTIRLTVRGRREPLEIETAGELVTWYRWVGERREDVERLMSERKAVRL